MKILLNCQNMFIIYNNIIYNIIYNMVKCAIVNYADNEMYINSQKKLRESINKFNPNIDFFGINNLNDINVSPEFKKNYGFKIYCIEYVKNLGYDIIIWCDSSYRLSKPIEQFILEIKNIGIYLQKDGWCVGEWANDKSLKAFNFTRDEMMDKSNIYACIIGFDFTQDITNTFFNLWKKAYENNLFEGTHTNKNNENSLDPRCKGHRHDQTCAELIAYTLNIKLSPSVIGNPENINYFISWQYDNTIRKTLKLQNNLVTHILFY
jgi:hypothetical protein